MKKLYKKFENEIRYAEAWVNEGQFIHHWGVVGDPGETSAISIGEETEEQLIDGALQQAIVDGFREIPIDEHCMLVISYQTEDQWGNEEDLEKRQLVEDIVSETLGWTGNGMCDGGDIGSGEMSVFSYVVDLDVALACIVPELGIVGLLEGATIRSKAIGSEEETEHPVPEEFQTSIFNEPEEEIISPTNQEEWKSESNPEALRAALSDTQLNARRCRLYAVGCCRRIWSLLFHENTRAGVEFIEALADGLADPNQFDEITEKAGLVFGNTSMMNMLRDGEMEEIQDMEGDVDVIKHLCELTDQLGLDYTAVGHAAAAVDMAMDNDPKESVGAEMCAAWAASSHNEATTDEAEQAFQSDLMRCVFESPFEIAKFDSAWRTPEVVELANHMYESRDFSHMPALGRLLQRNGCTDPIVLAHCQDEHHTRGCWLVDCCRG